MQRISIKSVMKHGNYEILKVTDCFGNWNYTLLYNGKFRIQSWSFERLKNIAINNLKHLAN